MPASRAILTAAYFLCAAVAGPSSRCEAGPAGAPAVRTVVMATSYPAKEPGPVGPAGSLVVITSLGKGMTFERTVGPMETVATTVEVALKQEELPGLFSKIQKIVDSGKYKGKPVAAKGGGKGEETTIALYGFRSEDVYLQRSGSKADPSFAEIEKIIKGMKIEAGPQTPGKQKVEHGSWTMAGEGASSSFSLDSGGYLESKSGGDIGCGYNTKQVTKKLHEAAAASAVFEKITALVKEKKLADKSVSKSPAQHMSDSYYILSGFSKSDITLRSGDDGYKEIAEMLAPVTAQDPKEQPFFASGIQYHATIKSPDPTDLEGEITLGGKWIQKAGGSGGKGKETKLKRDTVARILSDVRKLVEKARAKAGSPPEKSCAPTDDGITLIQVESFAGLPGAFTLNKNQFCEEFSAMKGILEDELSFAGQTVKK